LFEFAAAGGTRVKVLLEGGAFASFQRAQRVQGQVFRELFVHAHRDSTTLRNCTSPFRMRVFTVPNGSPVFAAISE
jgi:hypothetical protein